MQDESTGLTVGDDPSGDVTRIDVPSLAALRAEQLRYFGHWTAERWVL